VSANGGGLAVGAAGWLPDWQAAANSVVRMVAVNKNRGPAEVARRIIWSSDRVQGCSLSWGHKPCRALVAAIRNPATRMRYADRRDGRAHHDGEREHADG